MAKVTGPLMSMDARGAYGGVIVFSGWKGRATVRKLVIPANPKSLNQETARNRIRVGGAAQHFANATATTVAARGGSDKALLQAAAPAGYAWNGNLVDKMIGAGGITYTAALAAFAALTGPQQADWDTAADALVPAIPAVAQFGAGGAPAAALTSGAVFFLYTYGLYIAGVATLPGAVPPVYA